MTQGAFRTPKGNAAQMDVRDGTSDHNTLFSCLTEDEYGLKELDLGEGVALDIGAHAGGVSVGLAVDNPRAKVIAVEALGANVGALRANVEANGVSDRVTVVHAIAGKTKGKGTVRWNFDQGESGQHHRFIANAHRMEGGETEEADVVTLAQLVKMAGGSVAFAKVDCEGCEYDVLNSPAVKDVAEFRGEFHAGFDNLAHLLEPTHVVTMTSGTEAFGGFRAVRR